MSLTSQPEDFNETDLSRMPFWMHLNDLRKALIRSLLVLLIVTVVTYHLSDKVLYYLEKPILDALPSGSQRLYFTGVTDKFMVYLKAALYSAIFLAAPYWLWELWNFVSPGLYKKERRMVVPFLFFGTFFFTLGGAFSYFVVIPEAYGFLVNFGTSSEVPLITLGEYFKLTLQLILMMGFVFELPVVLMLLARFGIVTQSFLRKVRPQIYVGLSLLAAIITPTPDALTMLLVLVPLCLLFETSIWLIRFSS